MVVEVPARRCCMGLTRMTTTVYSTRWIRILTLWSLFKCSYGRFAVNGPVLTLTFKDPNQNPSTPTTAADVVDLLEQSSSSSSTAIPPAPAVPWLDLNTLRPNVVWEITSLAPPLPYWVPKLKQLKARVGYQYSPDIPLSVRTTRPSWIEGTAKFATNLGELIVQPSYEFQPQSTTILLEASRGASWALARLGLANRNQIVPHWEALRASFVVNLPYVSLSQLRFTPSMEVGKDLACQIEAVTGGYGRTRAVLNLEWQTPTLSVIHQLDNRNTIAPTINLYNARIVYQWNCLLGRAGTSSIRTKVDPTSAIDITWTDQSEQGGSWITDVRLPLEATTLQKLAADVRIRRQFRF